MFIFQIFFFSYFFLFFISSKCFFINIDFFSFASFTNLQANIYEMYVCMHLTLHKISQSSDFDFTIFSIFIYAYSSHGIQYDIQFQEGD